MREIEINIYELRKNGLSYKEVAKNLNISKDKVRNYCKKNNWTTFNDSINGYGTGMCPRCGKEFEKKSANQVYCSSKCYYNKKDPYKLICKQCGKLFETTRKDNKYCSEECKEAFQNNKKKKETKKECELVFCKTCGKEFKQKRTNQVFCSHGCCKKWHGLGRRYTSKKDERLQEAVKYDKSVNLHTLIMRDNNTCQICGRQCDLYDYEVTNSGAMMCGDKYPTIDHKKPCSKGGEHTWGNVQLACLKCNREKRDHYD